MNAAAELKKSARLEAAVDQLYRNRFPAEMLVRRNAVWRVLCRGWFDRYVPGSARVLEIGAGYCEFINNVAAAERVAIDLNPETRLHAAANVVVHEVGAGLARSSLLSAGNRRHSDNLQPAGETASSVIPQHAPMVTQSPFVTDLMPYARYEPSFRIQAAATGGPFVNHVRW
jgi:hypothetical protein